MRLQANTHVTDSFSLAHCGVTLAPHLAQK